MEEIENTRDIEYFIVLKKIMEQRYLYRWEKKYYTEVMDSINGYLMKYCKHNEIQDWIDIGPEESVMIVYCDKCQCTIRGK